jgi:6-phosphofructokinase 2
VLVPASIVTVTLSPALDIELVVDELLPDYKLVATSHRRDPGGGGVNVARVLLRMGQAVKAVVATGGAVGAELVARLQSDGLEVDRLPQSSATRESVAVRDLATGRQYRIGVPPPPLDDTERDARAAVAAAEGADIVVLSGRMPEGAPQDLYRRMADELSNPVTIVDTSGAPLREVVLGRASIIKPSRRELSTIVGRRFDDAASIAKAAHEVLAMGSVGAIVTSLGGAGALLARRSGPDVWYAAPPVVAVSAVGAGDSLVAGIAAGLASGDDLVTSVRRGVAAGSATVMSTGTDLCRPEDVDRLVPLVEMTEGQPGVVASHPELTQYRPT